MTQNNGRGDTPEPMTPFDEATDLIDEGDDPGDGVTIDRLRMPPVPALMFLVAILLSPLFGLVFGLNFAMGVLVIAMAVTTWLAWEGANRLVPEQRDRLRMAAMMNAAVGVLVLLLLIARVTGLV